ncbi:MAG: FecR domain-containing protein [Hyphomonadaceae bacterium]
MSDRKSAEEIEREAAEWVVRVDSDPALAPQLEIWAAEDPRHAGAYYRALSAWRLADRGRALGHTFAARQASGTSRRALIAAAAGLAVSVGAAGFGWKVWLDGRGSLRTAVGEIRWAPLADGSRAALNTSTVLDVSMDAASRNIDLQSGEAWFDVEHDPSRPFVVRSGPVRVRAVGTSFSVRRYGDDFEVIVTEGTVEAWREDTPDRSAVKVSAGRRVSLPATAEPEVTLSPTSEIEGRLAWRTGMIALEGRSLREAAEEFNRYNGVQLVIDGDDLAEKRIVGWFRATDVDAFTAAASIALGVQVRKTGNTIILSSSSDDGNVSPAHQPL